ncbi:MAG TPA: condensation domain-containing protein [Pyrinomonadaceae bacterium]
MNDLVQRLAALPPDKREQLLAQLPPLSFAQQRLWFIDQFEEGASAFYNMTASVRLEGQFNFPALLRTFNEIVRRHDTLRAAFLAVDGQPVQVVKTKVSLSLPIVDLSDLQQARRDDELQRLRREDAERPFDLSHVPLLRVSLVRMDASVHVVLLTMHHIVSDGWSIGVLIKEVAALYAAYAANKESPLTELSIQYSDFASWQRQQLQGESLEKELDYWRGELGAELPTLNLSTDRPRPAVQSYRGAHVPVIVGAELTNALRQLAQQQGATLFMVLLAAFQALLQRYSGHEQIVVGTPVAGREQPETETLIGFFVNTIVLRGDLSGNPSFTELLARVRQTTLNAYAHQSVPFEKLVEELQPQRSLSHAPLFQVMIVLQNTPAESLRLSGLTLTALPYEQSAALFDLLLSLTEIDGGISGSLQYSTDLFNSKTAEQIVAHFQTLLTLIAANPEEPIAQLQLLSEAERKQQLEDWNATAAVSLDDMPRIVADVVKVIWQEILGCDVNDNTNFLDAGGNDSTATQIVARVQSVLGIQLDQPTLFANPALKNFCHVIEERMLDDVEALVEAAPTQTI